jgi:CheY-like chemotaxis protein
MSSVGAMAGMSFLNDSMSNNDHESCVFSRRPRQVPALLDGLRILVLEDEFLIAMDVEQLCRDHGAGDVVIARDLAEVERNVAAQFDAAIVDLRLGGASTLDFASRLRESGLPFVFASGYADWEEIKASFPGIRLVTKPYSGDDLVEAVAAACGRGPPV